MKLSQLLSLLCLVAIHHVSLGADTDKPNAGAQDSKGITVLKNPPPLYPLALKEKGISGRVVLEATVDTAGKISKAKVIESSDPGFSEAALKAIRQWLFSPATKNGQPIATKVQVPFAFKTIKPPPPKASPADNAKPAAGPTPAPAADATAPS
jgi:protein TonB